MHSNSLEMDNLHDGQKVKWKSRQYNGKRMLGCSALVFALDCVAVDLSDSVVLFLD